MAIHAGTQVRFLPWAFQHLSFPLEQVHSLPSGARLAWIRLASICRLLVTFYSLPTNQKKKFLSTRWWTEEVLLTSKWKKNFLSTRCRTEEVVGEITQ